MHHLQFPEENQRKSYFGQIYLHSVTNTISTFSLLVHDKAWFQLANDRNYSHERRSCFLNCSGNAKTHNQQEAYDQHDDSPLPSVSFRGT